MSEVATEETSVISNIQRFSGYAEEAVVEIEQPTEVEEQVVETAIETAVETTNEVENTATEEVAVEVEKPIVEEAVEIDPYAKLGIEDPEHKEYLSKVVAAFKEGKLEDFLAKTQVNYDAIDDVEILKMSLLKEYPNANEKQIKILMERKLNEYNITGLEGNEEEDEEGELLLKLHTDKVREGLKAEQAQYKTKAYEFKPSAEDVAAQQRYDEFKEFINKSQEIELLERSKVIDFGELKADLPSDVNIRELALDPLKVFDSFFDKNGKMNVAEFSKAMYALKNYDKLVKDAMSLATSKAEKKHFDSLRGNEGGAQHNAPQTESASIITNIRRD